MFPQTKPVLVALLLAYRALAAPTSHDQQDQVQSVINALKVQIKELNPSWNPSIIDYVESALKANGVLEAEHITALNQKIEAMTAAKGLDTDGIAATTIEYLTSKGAFVEPEEQVVENKVLYLTTDMINQVLEQGGDAVKRDCPHPGRLCGGCVIL
ncbi:hypothetical protein INS49_014953 [Diaporthe citri]|uniref:uncharacterized protein n=1 Tax=Diaporthe citri TaxID=83186 RepID=UPI001C80A390|nr:uncharacterized protein INS49_014953 [Diaporthe citri]KAG6357076.1 hypothetical protein INS49_014953 [Diaporthe citri]